MSNRSCRPSPVSSATRRMGWLFRGNCPSAVTRWKSSVSFASLKLVMPSRQLREASGHLLNRYQRPS